MNVDQYTDVPGFWNREELKARLIEAVEVDKILKDSEDKTVIVIDSFGANEEK